MNLASTKIDTSHWPTKWIPPLPNWLVINYSSTIIIIMFNNILISKEESFFQHRTSEKLNFYFLNNKLKKEYNNQRFKLKIYGIPN